MSSLRRSNIIAGSKVESGLTGQKKIETEMREESLKEQGICLEEEMVEYPPGSGKMIKAQVIKIDSDTLFNAQTMDDIMQQWFGSEMG